MAAFCFRSVSLVPDDEDACCCVHDVIGDGFELVDPEYAGFAMSAGCPKRTRMKAEVGSAGHRPLMNSPTFVSPSLSYTGMGFPLCESIQAIASSGLLNVFPSTLPLASLRSFL